MSHDKLADAVEYLTQKFPTIASGLIDLENTKDNEVASQVIEYFFACNNQNQWKCALDAVAKLSFDFIRLHGRFLRKGCYRANDSKEFEKILYSNSEKMEDYLNGLLLSYALWPNHVLTYNFFRERFATTFSPVADIIEIGVGHGLMAATAMKMAQQGRYFGYDLSLSSLNYCKKMLVACGIIDQRITLSQCDATKIEAAQFAKPFYQDPRVICCEVLEHVEEPQRILDAIKSFVGKKGIAFITTVANIDAEDHVYLFHNADHIRKMINASGLTVIEEQVLKLERYATKDILPLNYSAIIRAI